MRKNYRFQIPGSKTTRFFISALFVLMGAFLPLDDDAAAELTAKANHDRISIDFFYHGSTIGISGISDPGTDLIVTVTAPDGRQALKKKGKVGGVLWMNVGDVKFERVPNVYFLHCTKEIGTILSGGEMEKYALGYPALKKHIGISPVSNDGEKGAWFKEFVRFKESCKLYATSYGKISTELKDGKQNYHILTQWPHQAPPGKYLVTVYAVKDNKVVEKAEANVLVEQAGVVKMLYDMARNNAVLYGIISIIAALGAGFGVGLIFGKGGGAH